MESNIFGRTLSKKRAHNGTLNRMEFLQLYFSMFGIFVVLKYVSIIQITEEK